MSKENQPLNSARGPLAVEHHFYLFKKSSLFEPFSSSMSNKKPLTLKNIHNNFAWTSAVTKKALKPFHTMLKKCSSSYSNSIHIFFFHFHSLLFLLLLSFVRGMKNSKLKSFLFPSNISWRSRNWLCISGC